MLSDDKITNIKENQTIIGVLNPENEISAKLSKKKN